jgi:Fe2+ or Zn2+ uptake regulation protein
MTDLENLIHQYLKSTGNNLTSQRHVGLKVLLEATGHLTVEEICHGAQRHFA